jgi:hypothetical protein
MKRYLVCSLIPAFLICAAAIGQPAFAQFIPAKSGFRFDLQQELTDPVPVSAMIPVSDALLEESGFRSFSVWKVQTGQTPPLTLEVIETADSIGTYELFNLWPDLSGSRDARSLGLPVGNRLMEQEGIFWKGRFFFRVRSSAPSLPEQAFVDLAASLAEAIPMENLLPVTVSHLPSEGLAADSVRFYLGAASLQANPVFPAPLLKDVGLSDRIEIAYGRYDPDGHGLFVIGYPTVALARDYLDRLQNSLQGFFSKEGIYMKRSGILIGLFVGPEEPAAKVLSQLNYTPSIQWVQDEKPKDRRQDTMTFLGLVTRAILGTGSLILLIIGTGTVTGLIRYGLIRRYPVLLRQDQMVRLNLKD